MTSGDLCYNIKVIDKHLLNKRKLEQKYAKSEKKQIIYMWVVPQYDLASEELEDLKTILTFYTTCKPPT